MPTISKETKAKFAAAGETKSAVELAEAMRDLIKDALDAGWRDRDSLIKAQEAIKKAKDDES